jgi:hypothetical protein
MCVWEVLANHSPARAVLWLSVAYWAVTAGLFAWGVSRVRQAGGFASGIAGQALPGLERAARAEAGTASAASGSTVIDPVTLATLPLAGAPGLALAVPGSGAVAVSVASVGSPIGSPVGGAGAVPVPLPNYGAQREAAVAAALGPRFAAGGQAVAPAAGGDSGAALYYAPALFPVHRFDPERGIVTRAHSGPALILASLALALCWGTAAMVFVSPSWAGVMVTNVVKVIGAAYVLDAVRRSQALQCAAVRLLVEAAARQAAAAVNAADTAAAAAAAVGAASAPPAMLAPPAPGLTPLARTQNGQLVAAVFASASPSTCKAVLSSFDRRASHASPAGSAPSAAGSPRSGGGAAPVGSGLLTALSPAAAAMAVSRTFLLDAVCTEVELALRMVRENTVATAAQAAASAAEAGAGASSRTAAASVFSAASSQALAGLSGYFRRNSGTGGVAASDTAQATPGAAAGAAAASAAVPVPVPGAGEPFIVRSDEELRALVAGPEAQLPPSAYSFNAIYKERALALRADCASHLAARYIHSGWSALQLLAPFLSRVRCPRRGDAAAAAHDTAVIAAAQAAAKSPSAALTAALAAATPHDPDALNALLASPLQRLAYSTACDLVDALSGAATNAAAPAPATASIAPAPTWADARALLAHVQQMDGVSSLAAAEGALFSAYVQHGLYRAGCTAAAGEFAAWAAFLAWCAQPHVTALLLNAGGPDFSQYHAVLTGSKSPADVVAQQTTPAAPAVGAGQAPAHPSVRYVPPTAAALSSRDALVAFWQREVGVHAASQLTGALSLVEDVYAQAAAAEEAAALRRRLQDAAADRLRRDGIERQREEERQRLIGEQLAADAAAAEALRAAAAAEAAERRRVAEAAARDRAEREAQVARDAAMARQLHELEAAAAAERQAAEAARLQREAAQLRAQQEAERAARRRAEAERARAEAARRAAEEERQRKQQAEAEAAASAIQRRLAEEEARRRADAAAAASAAAAAAAIAAAAATAAAESSAAAGASAGAAASGASAAASAAGTAAAGAGAGSAAAAGTAASAAMLDSHRMETAKKVSALIAGCGGKPYADPAFTGRKALGRDFGEAATWRRMRDFSPNPILVDAGGAKPNGSQGALGDCYLLSALSVLASHSPAYVDNLLITRTLNEAGVLCARFWRGGRWREVRNGLRERRCWGYCGRYSRWNRMYWC